MLYTKRTHQSYCLHNELTGHSGVTNTKIHLIIIICKDVARSISLLILSAKYRGLRLTSRKVTARHDPDDCHLPKFNDFHEFSRTDKALTVRETFCNMLITMKGKIAIKRKLMGQTNVFPQAHQWTFNYRLIL